MDDVITDGSNWIEGHSCRMKFDTHIYLELFSNCEGIRKVGLRGKWFLRIGNFEGPEKRKRQGKVLRIGHHTCNEVDANWWVDLIA